jgi:hypothetical protein
MNNAIDFNSRSPFLNSKGLFIKDMFSRYDARPLLLLVARVLPPWRRYPRFLDPGSRHAPRASTA